jgi:HPr kinase/phosphorylase
MKPSARIQCTAIAIDGRGVLLAGAPGVGKSDLALRLIGAGALLVGDDAVEVAADGDRLVAGPVAGQAGRIFVAGIGPVCVACVAAPVPLALCILIDPAASRADRMPALDACELLPGKFLPRLVLDAGPAAPDKVRLALRLWGH